MNADEMVQLLDELGRRLGPTGEYVFQLAVRQVYIDAVVSALILLVGLAAAAFVGPRIYRWVQADTSHYSDRGMVGFMAGVIGIVIVGTLLTNFVYLFPRIFNPEYAAIQSLFTAIHGAS